VNGSDIVFTAGDGSTELSREIETFTTGGSPMLNAWVKTNVSSSASTKIFMYYNGDSVANTTDTWDSNFTLVQHLQEDPAGPNGTGISFKLLVCNGLRTFVVVDGGACNFLVCVSPRGVRFGQDGRPPLVR